MDQSSKVWPGSEHMDEGEISGMLRHGNGAVQNTCCTVVGNRAGECESCKGRWVSCKWLADRVEDLDWKRRERHVGRHVPEKRDEGYIGLV